MAAASAGSLLAWLAWGPVATSVVAWTCGGAAVVGVVAATTTVWKLGSGVLGFDGSAWSWAPSTGGDARPGAVRVAVDLGSFLLLRFEPATGSRTVWLPVATAAGRDWHGLRAAVYSARSGAGPGAAGATPT